MSGQSFVVNLSNQDVVLRVAQTTFGQVRVAGGVPGPRGEDGEAGDGSLLVEHLSDTTPHPAYDDLPSLTLLFENGLI